MKSGKRSKKTPKYGRIVLVILVISIAFGFLFDFICTQIEYRMYPKEYSKIVSNYAELYGIPEDILYAVIKTESGFDSSAVSSAGAVGLMQLMPETFLWLTNDMTGEHLAEGMIYDPETNIRYGAYYLSMLYERYGVWETAFAAYNAGPGDVDSWLEDENYSSDGKTLSEIPYKETRSYVKKINKASEKYLKLYYN